MTAIRASTRLVAVAGSLLAVASATGRVVAQPPSSAIETAFGNCADLVVGPVCLLAHGTPVVVWVALTEAVQIRVDGAPAPVDPVPADGGTRYTIDLPAGAERLVVQTDDIELVDLAIGPAAPDPDLHRSLALMLAGDYPAARAVVEPLSRGPRRGGAARMLGRIALAQGNINEARRQLTDAIEAQLADGNRYAGLKDATTLAYLEMNKSGNFEAARQALAPFDPPPAGHGESRYFLDNFRGLIAFNAGDARGALVHLESAARWAARLGWARRALNAEMMLAVQLQQLGRQTEAVELLESWRHRVPSDMPPCEQADYYTNLGWTALLTLETGVPGPDPTDDLEQALSLYREDCSADSRVNGWINLALAAFHAGRTDQATAYLEAAREETPTPEQRMLLWWHDIRARIALAHNNPEQALAEFRTLDALATATLSPSGRWRAAVGRAGALEALGERAAALAAYADAESQIDGDVFRVPLDGGRESLLAARQWATQRHIGLALDMGDTALAFQLTRRARARVLRSVSSARAAASLDAPARGRWEQALAGYAAIREAMSNDNALQWTLPADALAELARTNRAREAQLKRLLDDALGVIDPASLATAFSPVAPGEVLLAFHPVAGEWAAFAQRAATLTSARMACPPEPAATAECLLAAVAPLIREADRVRILPVGELRGVDFHAASFDGDVLAATVAVTYGVDIAARQQPVPVAGHAVIVADPRGDLAAARNEARTVADALTDTGVWSHETLAGPAATDRALRNRLTAAALFHYAGHARFLGPRGWDSELALAGDTAFSVADILSLAAVPGLVILSGCETARTSAGAPPETLGLANAFLAAGTSAVIAASRPVVDTTALALVTGFYDRWAHLGAPEALRQAQLALRQQQPESDWAAFRLVTH